MKHVLFALLFLAGSVFASPYDAGELDPAIAQYQKIVNDGGWPTVDNSNTLREGDSSAATRSLIERLNISGDLDSKPNKFNAKVAAAVEKFQERHGLNSDGVVGKNTFAALNISAQTRLEQLQENGARLEEMNLSMQSYVLVNIPEYRMHYIEKGESQLTMRVIVGEKAWDTPTMSDSIEYVVFQPRWNIPVEIVAAELAPKVAKDPNYLKSKNMTIVSGGFFSEDVVDPSSIDWSEVTEQNWQYFVYQEAGSDNPLGQMKFIFPNNEDIYLHDTPNKNLFGLQNRARSHGCIRIEHPGQLAKALIKNTSEVEAAMATDEQVTIHLEKVIPVHLVYWTAWTNENGLVHFRDDIYDRDDV